MNFFERMSDYAFSASLQLTRARANAADKRRGYANRIFYDKMCAQAEDRIARIADTIIREREMQAGAGTFIELMLAHE